MVETSVVTKKGQLVIPARIRRRHGIKRGTRVCLIEQGEEIVLKPLTSEYFEKMAGLLGTGGKAIKALVEERAKDREREDHR